MFLKKYQQRVVTEFENFFRKAKEKKNEHFSLINIISKQSVPESMKQTLLSMDWVSQTFEELDKPYNESCTNGLREKYPRVVLKIPTGGGKTLLAVEAIRAYQTIFAQKRTGLVVWIVPSETIYSQTVKRLRDKRNFLRQLLDQSSGNRTIILEKGQRLTSQDISNNLVVLFVMIQSVSRANNKEALKVFQDSGGYETFFPADNRFDLHREILKQYPNLDSISPIDSAMPLIKTSMGNAIRVSRPLIIIDEIHKVYSETARKTIDNLNPEMVIGLSATPKQGMNVLITISGLELKAEEMIKLDMHIFPPISNTEADWQSMIREICKFRESLEGKANEYRQQAGIYIRPIALLQCEATGKDQRHKGRVHSLDVKDFLISLNINPSEIAIKTSAQNDIEDVDLLSDECQVRYIITKEALREGWDCPFAYILGIIPNVNSDTGVTQLVGRILRQPYVTKTGVRELDESYVYYSRGDTREILLRVMTGLESEGLGDLFSKVQVQNHEINPTKKVHIKREIREQHPGSLYLPVWIVMNNVGTKRRFSYDIDIKEKLDFSQFFPTDDQIRQIGDSFSQQQLSRTAYVMSIDDNSSQVVVRNESLSVFHGTRIDLLHLTRLYSDVIENPFVAYQCAKKHIELLGKTYTIDLLNEHFGIVCAMLLDCLIEEKRKQEEIIFLDLLNQKRLLLAVSDEPEIGYRIPDSEEITISREPSAYRCYLFDDIELASMNKLEREVGDLLDKQDRILWWFRNKVSRGWYSIQGWQKYQVHPDFIAAKQADDGSLQIIYVLESKGEQLLGNLNTQYKKQLFDFMTSYDHKPGIERYQQLPLFNDDWMNNSVEYHFIEEGKEEETVRRLLR